jgi:predicted DNA-binding transcriptional regulator AlpA
MSAEEISQMHPNARAALRFGVGEVAQILRMSRAQLYKRIRQWWKLPTIYRWVRAGSFPGKGAGGGRGWLRSDVERWLQVGGSVDPLTR